jgi:hypothetical protein
MNTNSNPITTPVNATFMDDLFPDRIAMEFRIDEYPEDAIQDVSILIFDDELEDDYTMFTIADNPSKLRQMAAWMLETAAWLEHKNKR